MSLSKRLRGLWWNTSFRRWIIASFLLYKASLGFVSAEQDLTPVFTYQEQAACAWELNNTLEILDAARLENLDGITTRFLYDPQTQALTEQGGLSYNFSLLTGANSLFPPVGKILYSDYVARTELYPSPDGRYVVYSSNVYDAGRGAIASITLADLQTKKSTLLPGSTSPNHFTVQWGFGSNAFVIMEEGSYGSDPFITYVSGFDTSLEHLNIAKLTGYSELAERLKLTLTLYQVLDIDSTGRYLLAQGDVSEPGFSPDMIYLMLIDTRDFTYETIAENRHFISARFEQPGDQHVFYFNLSSISVYDRANKTTQLLSDDVDNLKRSYSRTCQPTFSPDGRFIAFDDDETNEVIVLPIKGP